MMKIKNADKSSFAGTTADSDSTAQDISVCQPIAKPNVISGFADISVKVVGKIELKSSQSGIDKTIIRKFNHFFERLYGRYGILLTMDEYIFFSSLWPRKKIKSKDGKSIIGILTIKDVDVKVVKSLLPPKVLLTALIIKKKDEKKKLAAFERHRIKTGE